jgi:uncharacterized protein
MNEVFVDSFYYLALLNPDDQYHAAALAITRTLSVRHVTSHWVLMEVADALSRPPVRQEAAQFIRERLSEAGTTVIDDLPTWFPQGLSLFEQRPDKSWSLTDCISFQIMHARGIREALTGDHHFVQAGFVALLEK